MERSAMTNALRYLPSLHSVSFRLLFVSQRLALTIETARSVYRQLKRENKMIDISDILIASTAMANDLPLATLNRDHFERIRGLRLVG